MFKPFYNEEPIREGMEIVDRNGKAHTFLRLVGDRKVLVMSESRYREFYTQVFPGLEVREVYEK
jgi:hypothetical protein